MHGGCESVIAVLAYRKSCLSTPNCRSIIYCIHRTCTQASSNIKLVPNTVPKQLDARSTRWQARLQTEKGRYVPSTLSRCWTANRPKGGKSFSRNLQPLDAGMEHTPGSRTLRLMSR